MKLSKEDRSRGGKTAQSKVYYCHKCGGIGQGSQMVNNHLAGDCNGIQGRKLKKATERNSHRLVEAMHNTKVWEAEQINKEANQIMEQQRMKVLEDLIKVREAMNEVMPEAFETYYKKIF